MEFIHVSQPRVKGKWVRQGVSTPECDSFFFYYYLICDLRKHLFILTELNQLL